MFASLRRENRTGHVEDVDAKNEMVCEHQVTVGTDLRSLFDAMHRTHNDLF